MPFRTKVNALVDELQKAKELEIAAIERLRAYLNSHPIDVAHLKTLTDEMVENCERSKLLWRQLHDVPLPDESL